MNRSRERVSLEILSKPEITPLVDLTFLLLIVFMITAPVLEFSLEIKPPEFNAEKPDDRNHKLVNLDHKGTIRFDDNELSKLEFHDAIVRQIKKNKDLRIYIRADKSRPYGEVIEIMRIAKNAGIIDVSLITLAEEK